MQMLEGSTLLLVLILAALAVMIAVCTVLLAPYTLARALYRIARPHPALCPRPAAHELSPRFHS
jgi:hypothetical protein